MWSRKTMSDEPMRRAALQFAGHRVDTREKGFDEAVKLFPGRRQRKRAPVEKRRSQKFLQLAHLAAHRRLLDAVGNVPHRLADAPVPRDIIEKFQVVDVHTLK
jgi:hypothetical protein